MSELSEEDKKAIKSLKDFAYTIHGTLSIGEAKTVLNLIKNQQAELEKKDKMINAMAKDIIEYERDLKYEEPYKNIDEVKEYYMEDIIPEEN